jgi:hypothetical protein
LHKALDMDIPNSRKHHNSLDINNQALRRIKSHLPLPAPKFPVMENRLRLELGAIRRRLPDTPPRVESAELRISLVNWESVGNRSLHRSKECKNPKP